MVYLIGISGSSSSGKSSTCRIIKKKLSEDVIIVSMDNFYSPVPHGTDPSTVNFDHPNAFDWEAILNALVSIKESKVTSIPIYDFATHSRVGYQQITPTRCVIVEGILALYSEKVRNMFDIKIFVDTPADIRLIRRIRRDMRKRGRSLESILAQYEKTVIPGHIQFIEPTKAHADLVFPRGKTNDIGISVLVSQIQNKL